MPEHNHQPTTAPRSKAIRRAIAARTLRADGQRRPPGGFQQWELNVLKRLPTAPGIRIRTRRDGFGAQYLAQMSALAWATKYDRYYYFEPFTYVDHGEDASLLNSFTGLRPWGEPVEHHKIERIRFVPEVLSSPRPSSYFNSKTLSILRDMYWSTPKPDKCRHHIAIHIRRGDVDKSSGGRWVSNKLYINLVKIMKGFFPGKSIGIYSQGDPADFRKLTKLGACLELNRDLRQTFHELATAPLLVPAPSCLSYAAALLSEGNVLHLANRQTRPLEHWIHSKALTKAQLYRH